MNREVKGISWEAISGILAALVILFGAMLLFGFFDFAVLLRENARLSSRVEQLQSAGKPHPSSSGGLVYESDCEIQRAKR